VADHPEEHPWEEVNRITNRLAVPGGWIYEVRNAGVVFVPRLEVAYSAAESGAGNEACLEEAPGGPVLTVLRAKGDKD
jgi:hypothetical protein